MYAAACFTLSLGLLDYYRSARFNVLLRSLHQYYAASNEDQQNLMVGPIATRGMRVPGSSLAVSLPREELQWSAAEPDKAQL